MQEKIQHLLGEIGSFQALSSEEAENFRIRYLGKKGILTDLFADFKNVPAEEKKATGQLLNELKNRIQEKLESFKASFEAAEISPAASLDLTRPADQIETGARHPLSIVRN